MAVTGTVPVEPILGRMTMQYLMMLYLDESAWPKMTPAEQQQAVGAYRAFTEALTTSGAFRGTNRLQPTTTATTIRIVEGKTHVLDGPYADSKEQLGGYYLIDVPDLDTALSWAARCPTASHGQVELRPVWPMSNYAVGEPLANPSAAR